MLSRYSTAKPLYSFERSLDYEKHKRKLKQIQTKTSNTATSKSPQQRPWVKQKLKNELQKQNKLIQQQNQKLLFKLMKISTRNSIKVNSLQQHRDNPYRKNWLRNIKRQNQQLGDKLLNLKSSLQYSHFSKSIGQYQKVKRSMMINRRARLPQLTSKQGGSEYIKGGSEHVRATVKSQPNLEVLQLKSYKSYEDVQKANYIQIQQNQRPQLQLKLNKVQHQNNQQQQIKKEQEIKNQNQIGYQQIYNQ